MSKPKLIMKIHKDISILELFRIIIFKKSVWSYSLFSHYFWLKKNINKTDYHFYLLFEKRFIAYLNIIDLNLNIDGQNLYGLGNLSVTNRQRGRGHAKYLVNKALEFTKKSNSVILLFCDETLVDFYEKLGFHKFNGIYSVQKLSNIKNLMTSTKIKQDNIDLSRSF